MFESIDHSRLVNLSSREQRWLDNLKKAFHRSDLEVQTRRPEDYCLPELFKAVDVAKTLHNSLQGKRVSRQNNKDQFVRFLALSIPSLNAPLPPIVVNGQKKIYSLGDIVYEIRCAIHENENLNAAESTDHQILLDWSGQIAFVEVRANRILCDALFLWGRLGEILSKFITVIDSANAIAKGESFSITTRPGLGAIKPRRH